MYRPAGDNLSVVFEGNIGLQLRQCYPKLRYSIVIGIMINGNKDKEDANESDKS